MGPGRRGNPARHNDRKVGHETVKQGNALLEGQSNPLIFMRLQRLYGSIHLVPRGRRHISYNGRKFGGTLASNSSHSWHLLPHTTLYLYSIVYNNSRKQTRMAIALADTFHAPIPPNRATPQSTPIVPHPR